MGKLQPAVFFSFGDKIDQLISNNNPSVEQLGDCGYLPLRKKGHYYVLRCMGDLTPDQFSWVKQNSNAIFKLYTSEPGWYCSKVNLLLASDSALLEKGMTPINAPKSSYSQYQNDKWVPLDIVGASSVTHGMYVRFLKCAIGVLSKEQRMNKNPPLNMNINTVNKVWRGCDLSPIEIMTYGFKKVFYIPSFVSTSIDPNCAFPKKNTRIEIDISEFKEYLCLIGPEHSIYYQNEKECLISCYNIYEYLGYENGVLKLKLRNYHSLNSVETNALNTVLNSQDIVDALNLNDIPELYFRKKNPVQQNIKLLNDYYANPDKYKNVHKVV